MKKIHVSWLACLLVSVSTFGQGTEYVKPPSVGVHFLLNDYKSASNIRNSSVNSVLLQKRFGKIKEMTAGLALSYMKGLNNHFDFSITAGGSFVSYDLRNRPNTAKDRFLLEVDASFIGKMVSDRYWVTPYLQAGMGALKYGSYFGAFVPAGVGLQVNFFDEAFILFNSQYRIPITETANYHFYHSIGIVGNVGKKKDETTLKARPSIPFASN